MTVPGDKSLKKQQVFRRGAEWRRWDLHVHTPASALANEFKSWTSYIDQLERGGDGISVIGATDYCSIEGYKKLLVCRAEGRLGAFDLILPNIEFRLAPEMTNGRAVNIHLLVSPSDPQHVDQVERALRKLTFTYKGNPYTCSRDDLVALGKAHDHHQRDAEAAFRHGVKNFKPSFDVFREWYNKEGWLRANSLIAIANGKDGASGFSKDAGFAAMREELYRFSHLIFSPAPNDRTYFIGRGVDKVEEVIRKCGSLKACIHGSDAHTEARLFLPAEDRFCWIKADPTFEGLKQVLHEPEDRVHIGATAPQAADESKVIGTVTITGGEQWFAQPAIELNSGLVAIIGEKGSGKTALAELIAVAGGALVAENSPSSFISKAQDLLEGVSVGITWGDGEVDEKQLDTHEAAELPDVRYLSQDFVEELCSTDVSGKRLLEEIEQVVFSHVEEPDRLGTTSFADLRRLRTETLSAKRTDMRARISRLNAEIVKLEDELASKESKLSLIKKLEEEIGAIDKQLPPLEASANQAIMAQLQIEKEALRASSSALGEVNRKLNSIRTARSRMAAMRTLVEDHFGDLAPLLEEMGLSDAEIERFRPQFHGDCEAPLDRLERDMKIRGQELRGDEGATASSTGKSIADIQARVAGLETQLAMDEQQRERLLALQKQRAKLKADADRAAAEVQRIDSTVTRDVAAKRAQRWAAYLSHFGSLGEEKKQLAALYSPLKQVMARDDTGASTGFALNIKQVVDYKSWLESGEALFDKRKRDLPALSEKTFLAEYKKTLIESWHEANADGIRNGLQSYMDSVGTTPATVDGKLLSHASRVRLYDWLFSPEHIGIEYGLSFQGTPLEVLSPGTRGVVLLVLYLAMDQHDLRPVIIDQPEGNLDNSSVYDSLVPFLRRAKKRRQMILVTHNPNLVVAADADQVIVASATKRPNTKHPLISYKSGSLEDIGNATAIRELAVRLLEGGKAPFKLRDKRWDIPWTDSFRQG